MRYTIDQSEYHVYTASYQPDPARETVAFVHGTAMDHTVWALQSRYFAYHGYNIVALNLPGHGLSDGDSMDTIGGYADWCNRLLSVCPGSGLHLVGHSMGALIALQAAAGYADYSKPLLSLSLVGFSYPMTVSEVLLDAAKNDPSSAYAMMTQWSHTSPIGGEPNPGFWSSGSQMSMMENSRPGTVYNDLVACNTYDQGPQAFDNVSCPTLFVSGIQDKMAPCKLAKQQADAKHNAEILLIPNCGHSIMSESPDGVRDALRGLIMTG